MTDAATPAARHIHAGWHLEGAGAAPGRGMTPDVASGTLTRAFTDLLSAWPADDAALEARCRLLLLDGLAVAVAGAGEPGPTLLSQLVRRDGTAGPATVIGKGFSTSVVQAARINGMAMHVLDFEPMWNPPNHALSPLLPALLALAEMREQEGAGPQGRAVLRAVAKGVEAQGRLRLSSGQIEPAKLSMHPPGAAGPLAAALACGDLLGLSGARLAAAVGIAASRCGGLLANVGSMTKALHCGDAAANGVESAMLAAAGFTANSDALGSPRGWGPMLFGPTFDTEPLLHPLTTPRALDPGPAWKLFPSQFATHFAITAALEAREAAGGGDLTRRVRRVELRTPAMPYIDRPRPDSGLDGKFSWQYTAAIALLDGRVDPASFTDVRRFADDAVALLDRTVLVTDPAISGRFDRMYVEIAVELDDGTTVVRRCDAPLGSWTRPVPPERVRAKARALMAEAIGLAAATAVDGALASAGDFEVRALMALL